MSSSLVQTSKLLSLVLRHDPARIGLTLDGEGWADVDELLAAAGQAGVRIDRSILEQVVAENDKQRFAFSPDGVLASALTCTSQRMKPPLSRWDSGTENPRCS